MKRKNALTAACAGAFLMCSAAFASDTSEAPPPASAAGAGVFAEAREGLEPGSIVLLEVPGNVQGSVEIVAVPIEVLAMMLMQGDVQVQAQPERPIAPKTDEIRRFDI